MNFYILDDDINVIKKLEFIIETENLGYVIGQSCDSEQGLKEIKSLNPAIVLIDVLMPKKDGISIVKEIKENYNLSFIMVSQVSNKEMISEAYHVGIEFFISKPIIKAEVIRVIETVKSKITLNNALNFISSNDTQNKLDKRHLKTKKILNSIGIASEKGSHDLLKIINYLMKNQLENTDFSLKDISNHLNLTYTTSMQRIRRALMKGLENVAAEGIEDFYSVNVSDYGNKLYGFSEIRQTMECLRGKSNKTGTTNITHFIKSLLILNNEI